MALRGYLPHSITGFGAASVSQTGGQSLGGPAEGRMCVSGWDWGGGPSDEKILSLDIRPQP